MKKIIKLKELLEGLEVGKVYTDKDRPPFQVAEGEKRNSHNAYMKYYKAYEAFARETMDLAKATTKLSGDKTDEKIIIKNFKKYVVPFAGLMNGWDKGQQQNPGLSEQAGKKPIKEAKIPQFKTPDDISYYDRDWGKIFDQLESYSDYGPRESDMYDWNNRSLYENATKEFHAHMSSVASKFNSAVKSMENSWKVWDKILKNYRKKDRS